MLHNDDTGMRILRLAREPSDKRTGVFTSGIVSVWRGRRIALFFTGRQHAGENLADVLKRRSEELRAPIQMCDALVTKCPEAGERGRDPAGELPRSRETPVCGNGGELSRNSAAMCWRCWAMVYANDAEAREQKPQTPEERLHFHQQYSGPLMEQLHDWLETQLASTKTEPNSGLGKAISYAAEALEGADAVSAGEGGACLTTTFARGH